MKRIALLSILAMCMYACSSVPSVPEGKELAETIIKAVDKAHYSVLSEYYTNEFNTGESQEIRIRKYEELKEVFGDLEKITLIDSSEVSEEGIVLKFLVKHSKMNSIETFIIVKDEGKCKAASHLIRNE